MQEQMTKAKFFIIGIMAVGITVKLWFEACNLSLQVPIGKSSAR